MDSQMTVSTIDTSSELSSASFKILGEIVGATNLVAALREEEQGDRQEDEEVRHAQSHQQQLKIDSINACCVVHWGDEIIHKTKTVPKNNNPIWACDTGSLFKIELDSDSWKKDLKIEVYDRIVKKKSKKLLGVVIIPGSRILNGSICDERRLEFEIHKNRAETLKESREKYLLSLVRDKLTGIIPATINPWAGKKVLDTEQEGEVDEDGGGSICEKTAVIQPNINDDFIFGKVGTLALRFRVASREDLAFLKAVEIYNQGHKYAKMSAKFALSGIRHLFEGRLLAQIASEKATSFVETVNCDSIHEMMEFRLHGRIVDDAGVRRLRVKPFPDPRKMGITAKFLSKAEMLDRCLEPSQSWVEAGSGNLGHVKVEILSCEGLPNNDMVQMFGNKTDPFCCLVYEDCLVQTDVIPDCLSPIWMPWTQRAFIFNRMYPLSSIYIGVFNHNIGPQHHTGCGRIAIDLRRFEPNTVYTVKYQLFSSPIVTNRKSKGFITIRLQLTNTKEESMMYLLNPPVVHVNVKRKKTLAVARYTCYGKYREDVYNMKVLRSYIDEFLGSLEVLSFELSRGLNSLMFWKGQVQVGSIKLPLHSFVAFVSASYVIERPHLIPAYFCFCAAWCMGILMTRHSNHPSPWHKSRPMTDHLTDPIPFLAKKPGFGLSIDRDQGYEEMKEMETERKRIMEEDKLLQSKIATLRRELQQFLVAISDVNLVTSENRGGLNPLSKLLPVQLFLRDVMYYVRWVKVLLGCHDSQLSYILTVCFILIGCVLVVLPVTKILHWTCRLCIWIGLGPWMRLVDMLYNNKSSNRQMKKHVQKMMDEIQERERKRWMEARIFREEALKLKATRVLRFGRFAVNVPPMNITRFYDYPLPESTARPSSKKVNDENVDSGVTTYIPGQRHHGVMVPELMTSVEDIERREKEKIERLAKLKSMNLAASHDDAPNELQLTDRIFMFKSKDIQIKTDSDSSSGLFLSDGCADILQNDTYDAVGSSTKSSKQDGDDELLVLSGNGDGPHGIETETLEIRQVLSDLTSDTC